MSLFDDLPEPINIKRPEKVKTPENLLKRKLSSIDAITPIEKLTKMDIISYKSCVSARKGERDEMQDEHLLLDDYIEYIKKNFNAVPDDVLQCAIYGVYDGHNGTLASKFARENVHRQLASMFPEGNCDIIANDIKRIFVEVYKKVDEDFLKLAMQQRPYIRDGSTAVNVLIVNNTLYVAHIGDSKAVLGRQLPDSNLTAISLTKDHTAIDYDERIRIQKLGSIVREGRVNGLLEVSRSFGDYQYKKQGVISVPDVKKCLISKSDRFVIIACDGLWRSFTPLQAVNFVNDIVTSEINVESMQRRYEIACGRLTSEAVMKMSGDNVTAVIVAFHI